MDTNHAFRHWPVRRFTVVDDSMRPALIPGDGLLALRGGEPRIGQLRVFRDPTLSTRWQVKRVGDVRGAVFEARSDNSDAPGAEDPRWVAAAGSYRVVWTVRAPRG